MMFLKKTMAGISCRMKTDLLVNKFVCEGEVQKKADFIRNNIVLFKRFLILKVLRVRY